MWIRISADIPRRLIVVVGHSSVYELFSALHLTTRQKYSSAAHGVRKYASCCLQLLNAAKWRFRSRLPQSHADLEADTDNKTVEETVSLPSLQKVETRDPQADGVESKARSLTGSALNVARAGFEHKKEDQELRSQESTPHGSGSHFLSSHERDYNFPLESTIER